MQLRSPVKKLLIYLRNFKINFYSRKNVLSDTMVSTGLIVFPFRHKVLLPLFGPSSLIKN